MTSDNLRHGGPLLFAKLTNQEVSELVSISNRWTVAPKIRLCSSGVPSAHLLVLRSGQTKYYRTTPAGKEEILCWFAANDSLGLSAMLEVPGPNLGTAESATVCEFFVWNSCQARKAAREHPQLAINALNLSLNYIAHIVERHPEPSNYRIPHRIARALLDVAHNLGNVTPHGIDVSVTNGQLGFLAGVDPTAASHVINGWHKKAFISKGRSTIRIHCLEALAADLFQPSDGS